jgi:hypothetical protein
MVGVALAGLAVFSTPIMAEFPAEIDLSALNGSDGFRMRGECCYTGSSVSNAGDINGDGIDDLIIGRLDYCNAHQLDCDYYKYYSLRPPQKTYVVFGRDTAAGGEFPATFALSELNGSNGFSLKGVEAYEGVEFSVSRAGDINGVGIDDLLIGAKDLTCNDENSGAAFVAFGGNSATGDSFAASIEVAGLMAMMASR